ncbi:MAG: helix-hairpin-helix domain-containing protein [Candidatus Cloacimonetes bacterium]|nr:helix-hairpin-helix domain-containing protein [Candidatus Cloacimonadota bacterium]MBL7086233.1 helix-hairpin-helix domain-containing protein [Candidatus Cloacimonadota bacterium]
MKKLLFFLILILCFCQIYADDEDQIEKLFSTEDETYKATELHSHLQNLKKNKLNINQASYQDLIILPWLSPVEVEEIIQFRNKIKITNKKQLKKAGIPEYVIEEINPYISFGKSSPIYYNNRIRVEYKFNSEYSSAVKLYQKHSVSWKNYQLNFISQKDEGEKDFWDFWVGSLSAKWQNQMLKKIVIGNYRLALGQGIIFAPKLGLSKGGNATRQPIKYFSTIKQYTSTMESYSLFGAAAKIRFGRFQILPFFSDYNLDGNIKKGKITSLDIMGFHRTETETAKKDKVREKIWGGRFSYGNKNQIGFTALNLEFNLPFSDENIKQKQEIFGLDFQYNLRNFNFLGEGAISENKKAFLLTFFWEQGEFENLIIFRNYDKYFPTFHGNPFHTSGDFDNERGIYYGISFRPFEKAKLDMYFDIYKFPKQKSLENMPTYGFDKFLQFEKKWNFSKMRLTFQQKQYERWRTFSDESKIYQRERNIFRLDWRQKISPLLEIKLRGEYTFHQYQNADKYDSGILLYQDFKFLFSSKLTNYIRICQYHTDDIILYMYENDLDGIMLNSQFRGDGIFMYFLIKYDLGKCFSLQMKYAEKIWKEIKLERSQQIKFQIETKF